MLLNLAVLEEDLKFLYDTRKHPEVANMLTGNAPTEYEQHVAYVEGVQCKKRWIFIASLENEKLGYCQIYDVTDRQLEVGFVIHPDFQGRGFGKDIVSETIKKVKEIFPDRKIVLYVKKDNHKAAHIYRLFGFVDSGFKDDTIYMELR